MRNTVRLRVIDKNADGQKRIHAPDANTPVLTQVEMDTDIGRHREETPTLGVKSRLTIG